MHVLKSVDKILYVVNDHPKYYNHRCLPLHVVESGERAVLIVIIYVLKI